MALEINLHPYTHITNIQFHCNECRYNFCFYFYCCCYLSMVVVDGCCQRTTYSNHLYVIDFVAIVFYKFLSDAMILPLFCVLIENREKKKRVISFFALYTWNRDFFSFICCMTIKVNKSIGLKWIIWVKENQRDDRLCNWLCMRCTNLATL